MKTFEGIIYGFASETSVFVFGSNTLGHHGGGAALYARLNFGALMGQARGPQGQSYAIPTCTGSIEPLPLDEIQTDVDQFLDHVRARPRKTFFLTAIGTGIAGGSAKEMAYLFRDGVDLPNLVFPDEFLPFLLTTGQFAEVVNPNKTPVREAVKR